jgi:hypothetical protein
MEENMKGFVITALVLGVVGVGVWFAGTHYVVNTSDGIKTYPKSDFNLGGTYVDMNSMSFIGLRNHVDLVEAMVTAGDLGYVPGGKTLEKVAGMGQSVVDAVSKFDSEYKVTSSLNEIGRIGENKWSAADSKYDISGKAQKAADYMQGAASQFNGWLKSK